MKPGIYSQVYIHLVFSPRSRKPLLQKEHREEIFSYMSGIITKLGHKSININGVDDHVHILIGLNPTISISELVRDIKKSSALFINERKFSNQKFAWQVGYGTFSYSHSHLDRIYNYIENQEIHHSKKSFQEEFEESLKKYGIPFDQKFMFNFNPD